MGSFSRLFLVLFCSGYLTITFSQSNVPNYVPTNGLVGWWPFNGNADDESGNGNNGAINGATLTADRYGNLNKAYSFDGINDWIQVANNASLNFSISQEYSLSFWLKTPINASNIANVICKWDNSFDPYPINISIASNAGSSIIYMARYGGGTTQDQTTIQSITDTIFSDQFHHLVLNFAPLTGISYFLNGTFIGNSNINGITTINNNYPLYFGRRGIRTDRFYNGILDDIGIWNHALTQQEITNLYNAGPFDISATNTTICSGQTATLSVNSLTGSISSLSCSSGTSTGTLTAGTEASGVSSSVTYTGGNGGTYNGQIVSSTGVMGLTATLSAGTFASGTGSLTYTISGTPSGSGTASFALNIGGQSCVITLSILRDSVSVTDIDGNVYPTVQIGEQIWMKENLRTTKYSDGSDIPLVTDNAQWASNYNNGTTFPMMCWYNNDQATYTANKFGALYNWYAVNPTTNGNKNVCPTGWHVPSDAEWTVLSNYLGGSSVAGGKMKTTGMQYWQSPNIGATNESGFSGLPGGFREYDGYFYGVGYYGWWWSSTENGTGLAYGRHLIYDYGSVESFSALFKTDGFSVRCLRD